MTNDIQKTFTSPDLPLEDILNKVKDGKIQIPEFQRGWVWDDVRIQSLLASISLSYPIGALMMLKDGNTQVRFKTRLVEGVDLATISDPELLILDGQQRLTSLFQSLKSSKAAETRDARGKAIRRWYYIDIEKALNPSIDREEAIFSIAEDKKVRNFRGEVILDYSTPDKEFEAGVFPLTCVFNDDDWRNNFNEYHDYNKDKVKLYTSFSQKVVKRFQQYQIPVIQLEAETPKVAVCQVFEKVNTGGVSLTVFELLTATFAADDYSLRDDWMAREKRFRKNGILSHLSNTDFLQALSLLATHQKRMQQIKAGISPDNASVVSCKRKEILNLSLDDYKTWADPLSLGFERAARFLHTQKIFSFRDIPYTTHLVPLASILAVLGDKVDNDGVRSLVARWYWCGVMGELYGSAVESRFARDLPEVLDWVDGGNPPTTAVEATFNPDRLLTLRRRNSAAYKGIYALLLKSGALDFRTGYTIDDQMYFDESIDIHHIFPQDWCDQQKISPDQYDSIINKTPLSAKTNRMIGGNAPSTYLERLEKSAGINHQKMDEIISSHEIDPSFLRKDDVENAWKARQNSLLRLIESAMGKPVVRSVDNFVDDDQTSSDDLDE